MTDSAHFAEAGSPVDAAQTRKKRKGLDTIPVLEQNSTTKTSEKSSVNKSPTALKSVDVSVSKSVEVIKARTSSGGTTPAKKSQPTAATTPRKKDKTRTSKGSADKKSTGKKVGSSSKAKRIDDQRQVIDELEKGLKRKRATLTTLRKRQKDHNAAFFANGMWELPPSSPTVSIPDDLFSDAVFVWSFLSTFCEQLRLTAVEFSDLVELLAYTGGDSAALSELGMALSRLLLTDLALCTALAPPPHLNFASRSTDTTSKPLADRYNGLKLLPRKLRTDVVRPLTWQAIARALLLRLDSFLSHALMVCISSDEGERKLRDCVLTLLGEELVQSRRTADVDYSCRPGALVQATLSAASLMEAQEFFELPLREKLVVLKLFCLACYDTNVIRSLMEANADERLTRLAAMEKTAREGAKSKASGPSAVRRAAVVASLRQANMTAAASDMKTIGNKCSDPFAPCQVQLAVALEQASVLESLGVEEVLTDVPAALLCSEDDDVPAELLDIKQKSQLRQRRAREKGLQKPSLDRRQIDDAIALLIAALDSGLEKGLRAAIRNGRNAGLQGEYEGREYCTELMARALVLQNEQEQRDRAARDMRANERALTECFVRTEPLGRDSAGRLYYSFDGPERGPALFVETVCWRDKGPDSNSTRRPADSSSSWALYSSASELWSVYDRLLAGSSEDEKTLRTSLKACFQELEERPHEYITEGSALVGRRVRREFGKGRAVRVVVGRIVGWLPPEGSDSALWHVRHLDGDEEDLELHEVEAALVDGEEDVEAELGGVGVGSGMIKEAVQPSLVRFYVNAIKGATVKPHEVGQDGIRAELVLTLAALASGLKDRGSKFGKEERRDFEQGVRMSTSVSEFQGYLLGLEAVVRATQECEDERDEEEDARLKSERRDEMLREGWLFWSAEFESSAPMLGSRVRRFFSGHGFSDGRLIGYLPAASNEDGTVLWHMEHDDGDSEDLDQEEAEMAVRHLDEDSREGEEQGKGGEELEKPEEIEEEEVERGESTLWPTAGVRERWQDAVRKSMTIAELALALIAFTEQCKSYRVIAEDVDLRRSWLFASPGGRRRSSASRSIVKLSKSGRVMRATSRHPSYREL